MWRIRFFLLPEAMLQNADAFISADFKYHDFFEANDQTIILDIGHFESEQHTIGLIFDLISKNSLILRPIVQKLLQTPYNTFNYGKDYDRFRYSNWSAT